jgi:uncharacterized damage-inducible protein DinB
MDTEIARITYLLEQTYGGNPWHGSSICHTLENVTVSQATACPIPHCHTIAELVRHVTAWRTFALEKLRGNAGYDIATPEQDWPSVGAINETGWQQILAELSASQGQLMKILSPVNDEKLLETVPGREYDFYFLLHGVIQHDLYHLGQMALLRKTLAIVSLG